MSLKAPLIGLVINRFWISSYGTHQYSPHKDLHCCVLPVKYGKGFTLKRSSCFVNYGSFCTIHFPSSIWECCQSRRSGTVQCDCVCEGLYSREVWNINTLAQPCGSQRRFCLNWKTNPNWGGGFSKCCLFAHAVCVVLALYSLKNYAENSSWMQFARYEDASYDLMAL